MRAKPLFLLAGVVAWACTGCTHSTTTSLAAGRPVCVAPPEKLAKKDDGPLRKPTVELCLRAGDVKESLADEAKDNGVRDTLYAQAKQAYQQAIDLDPIGREGKLRLARLHEKTGNPQLTVAMLHDCIKQKPEDAALWYELGMCYARQKHWDSSIQCLRKATTLEPGNATYGNHLGFSLARAGKYDECLEYFKATVGEAQAHLNLAKMLQHVGRTDLARQHAQFALQLEPRLADARKFVEKLENDPGVVQTSATVP